MRFEGIRVTVILPLPLDTSTATFYWLGLLMGRLDPRRLLSHQLVNFAKCLRATSRICLCFRVRQRFIHSFFLDSTSPVLMIKLHSNLSRTRGLLMGIYQPGYTQEVDMSEEAWWPTRPAHQVDWSSKAQKRSSKDWRRSRIPLDLGFRFLVELEVESNSVNS